LYTIASGGNELRDGSSGLWLAGSNLHARSEAMLAAGPNSLQGISLLAIWDARYATTRLPLDLEKPDAATSAFYAELAGDFVGLRAASPKTPPEIPDDTTSAGDLEDYSYTLRIPGPWNDDPTRMRVEVTGDAKSPDAVSSHGPTFSHHASDYSSSPPDMSEFVFNQGPSPDKDPGPPGPFQKAIKWVQRHPIISGLTAGFFTLLTAAIVARTPGPGSKNA
jgi:hypothetical protein